VDNCFVKFNVIEFTRLVVESFLVDLLENHQYPRDILHFDYDKHLSLQLNNAVWDIDKGIVLKLGENKLITHGMLGL
jgi:hypothetical protein